MFWQKNGSGDRARTCDNLINSQVLYQLSYTGAINALVLEAAVGIEPTHGGFAVPSVPTSPHGRFVTFTPQNWEEL